MRNAVAKAVSQGEGIVVVSPYYLCKALGLSPSEYSPNPVFPILTKEPDKILLRAERFLKKHREELDARPRPASYMIGFRFSPQAAFDCRFLEDPLEILNLIGRCNGTLYVPDRRLRLSRESLRNAVCFLEKEFGYVPR